MLSVGIVGLPNVGKSTLFNALTEGGAEVSNYPFTTIDPNVGQVCVPDPRLGELERLLEPEKTTPCAIRFTDIAGLVKGASRGEGLGNQFLGEIRSIDAVAHVVRCFHDPNVTHVFDEVDPVRDAEVIETELMLADLEVLARAMEKRDREWCTHPERHRAERERFQLYQDTLEKGVPLRTLDLSPAHVTELKGLGLLTGKPLLFVANVAEDQEPADVDRWTEALLQSGSGAEVVAVTAALEAELRQLEPEERQEFMVELGWEETGLERLVRSSFSLLGLITFFTVAKSKLQAWEIPAGTGAQAAAGKVHTDMERGFIRARVAPFAELREHGSLAELQRQGGIRTVGKDYQLENGDVVEFLFNA